MATIVEYQERVLKDFGSYQVILTSYDKEDETSGPYQVKNVDTTVVEFQSFVLPAAIEMGHKLSSALVNLNREIAEEEKKGDKVVSLVPKSH